MTRKEKTVSTPVGPVKKLVEEPLWPIAGFQAGPSSQPQPVAAPQMQEFDVEMSHAIDNAVHEACQNKVSYAERFKAEVLIGAF